MAVFVVGSFLTLLGFGHAVAAEDHPAKLIAPAVCYREVPEGCIPK